MDKQALPTLTDAITELVGSPDEPMPDGRCTEERLRTLFKECAEKHLSEEELETIWPVPKEKEEVREGSKQRKASKVKKEKEEVREGSKQRKAN